MKETQPQDAGHSTDSSAESAATEPGDGVGSALNPPRELGGREGPDPTRFGDWEKAGRCIDF